MLLAIYLIIGAILGYKEINDGKGINEHLTERHLVIFLVFLFLWLPIYFFRFLAKKGFDFDLD